MSIKPNHLFLLILLATSCSLVSCSKFMPFSLSKNSMKDKESQKAYTMGYVLGNNIKKMEENLKVNAFLKGIKDSLNNKKSLVDQNQLLGTQPNKTNTKQGKKVMEKGKNFLEENSKKSGVKTTASGLQYEVITNGSGKQPQATDTVEVHYRGTLIDGTEFDSSYKRNKSISFPLNRVIKGWTEGVQLMKEGSKYKFYIPSELGYGAQGAGAMIPPNATLIFEVELIKVL